MRTRNSNNSIDYSKIFVLAISMILTLGISSSDVLGIGCTGPCEQIVYDGPSTWHCERCESSHCEDACIYYTNLGYLCRPCGGNDNKVCCDGGRACYNPVTQGCCNNQPYDKTTQKCCPGLFGMDFICDINNICCDVTCCNPKICELCTDYMGLRICTVCDNDPTLKCYNGHCCCAPNGCGPCSGVPSVPNNPAGCSDTSFLDACNAHDDCYGECHNHNMDDKNICDANFLQAMQLKCLGSSSGEGCIISCLGSALTYYEAVHSRGQGAFDASQACSCGG
jgi:hypothetical protein